MMLFHFFVFIIAVSANKIGRSSDGQACGENAIWNDCASRCQIRSCDKPDVPKICADICEEKRYTCKLGYVNGPHGKCILKKDCPPIKKCSGQNEIWNECGSHCEEQCEEPEDPRVCPAVCVPKCSCTPGHVRGPGGNCVAKEDCHLNNNCSDPNAVWNECGSNCEEQCEEPEDPRVCPAVCIPKCSCKPGHVIGPVGNCVAREDCPTKINGSDPHAVWNDCVNPCNQHSCDDSDIPKFCATACVARCVCERGYVMGPDGKCILPKDCPPKKKCSDEHEIWTDCGTDCEEQCEEPENPRICPAVCVPKCSCKPGLVRGPNGKCIAKEKCPKECPGKNQFWNECGSYCERTCDKSDDDRVCPAVCVKKCSCNPGYVLAQNGDCVEEEDCDSSSEE